MACMKRPYRSEAQALANRDRLNKRKGKGPTQQIAYPCEHCTAEGFPPVWHTLTHRPEADATIVKLRNRRRRHRPAAQAWQDEDYEGQWAA